MAATSALAGCAQVPDLADYLASGDDHLRRAILGADNPLGRKQRQQVLSGLSPAQSTDALERQLALQAALSASPIVPGNAAHLLRDGTQALPSMFTAMRQARDHINLEYYILEDVDWNGTHLSDLLLDRLRHGVRVNIIYDAYGSTATPPAFFEKLHAAGARVLAFNPIDPFEARTSWAPNHRDHRKIMVVDGRIGFTGGMNLAHVYQNPPSAGIPADGDASHAYWRDAAVRIEGPAVAELQKLFFSTWQEQHGPAVAPAKYFPPLATRGEQRIRIIGSAPGDRRPLYYVSLMTAVLSARERVWLSTGYFVPPHEEREVFANIARAGIDLRLVLPSWSDVEATVYAARASYGDLLESGAHIYEVRNAILHSKLATVDGVWSVVGSSNLDRRSVVFNNEVDAIILGRDTAEQLEDLLRQDIAQSHEITLAAWRERSLGERLDELKARIWQYWM